MSDSLYDSESPPALIGVVGYARLRVIRRAVPHLDNELLTIGQQPQAYRVTRSSDRVRQHLTGQQAGIVGKMAELPLAQHGPDVPAPARHGPRQRGQGQSGCAWPALEGTASTGVTLWEPGR